MHQAQMFKEFYMPKDGDEQKRLLKEAIDEWLDKKFAQFGLVSFRFVAALIFGALVYYALTTKGWTPPAH
jgi:hypothetical protein